MPHGRNYLFLTERGELILTRRRVYFVHADIAEPALILHRKKSDEIWPLGVASRRNNTFHHHSDGHVCWLPSVYRCYDRGPQAQQSDGRESSKRENEASN